MYVENATASLDSIVCPRWSDMWDDAALRSGGRSDVGCASIAIQKRLQAEEVVS